MYKVSTAYYADDPLNGATPRFINMSYVIMLKA